MLTTKEAEAIQEAYSLTDQQRDELQASTLTWDDLDHLPAIEICFTDEELEEMRNEKLYAEQFDEYGEELEEQYLHGN